MVHEIYNRYAPFYDWSFSTDRDYDDRAEQILSLIKRRPVKNILFVACGAGALAARIKKRGYRVFGTDLNDGVLRLARKKGIETFRADMRTFRIKKRFDAIVCERGASTYFHQKHLKKLFSNFKKHLNGGGIVIFDSYDIRKMGGLKWLVDGKKVFLLMSIVKIKNYFFLPYVVFSKKDGSLIVAESHKLFENDPKFITNVLHKLNFKKIRIYDRYSLKRYRKNSCHYTIVSEKQV